jgi:2,4-dienoyl-CoA reductase-like NADH-dependent reductase (Old Yellow Enzyme family)
MEKLCDSSGGASVDPLDEVLRRMASDEFDLIAVGRALLSDPDWPNKVRDGRFSELRPFEKSHLDSLL